MEEIFNLFVSVNTIRGSLKLRHTLVYAGAPNWLSICEHGERSDYSILLSVPWPVFDSRR